MLSNFKFRAQTSVMSPSLAALANAMNSPFFHDDFCLVPFRDRAAFTEYRDSVSQTRRNFEATLTERGRERKSWRILGYCKPCRRWTRLELDWQYSDGKVPNFRERLTCRRCGLNNRQRFMTHILDDWSFPDTAVVYCYEAVTRFYTHLQRLANFTVLGSEYLGHTYIPGITINGIRHEDALQLSFQNDTLDGIVANDVYEHVPDIRKAFKEAYRVLKPGARLIFSVPFHQDWDESVQRAELIGNEIIYHLPAAYHGNPISEKGSLVFYDFGWDLLDICKESGFRDVYVMTYYSRHYGYLGNGLQFAFLAEK